MKLSNKTQALTDLIAPAVQACQVELWGVEFLPQGKRSLVRIYIDKKQTESTESLVAEANEEQGIGVGVDDCVRVTKQVGSLLDVHDPIAGEYALEVSSPGWDRTFFSLEQMQPYIGQMVALRLIHAVENRRKFQAKLVEIDPVTESITLLVEGSQLQIASSNIDKINLVYQQD